MAEDPNIFRFLLTTDNHLGYMEKDPRRGKDSFVSFEECLREAVSRRVDGILLSGDLFHENKPTLSCLTRTMTLMKRYVMGDAPVNFSLLSDPKVNFPRHPVQLANFQDPNINVALPIFMIHGNHDDPVGGHGAIDILASSSLVNYFGTVDNIDDIVLRPVLLQKGATRIALYGLGNVRDERLHRAFRYNKVRFVRPRDGEGWFTILLFHQNRGLRSAFTKAGIQEKMLQGFGIDLVIWGNEHEQLMSPQLSEGYDIIQPGSSVMTSLSASESNPKQFGILEVRGTAYRVTGYPIQSCRPVVRRTVELWRDNPNGRSVASVEDYLRKVTDGMIDEAQQLIQHIPPEVLDYHPNIKFPLMRLAVDFHDPDSAIGANYPIPNVNRFGQQFLDAVANAGDMLKPINDKHRRRAVQHHVDLEVAQQAVPQNIPVTDIRAKLAAALATNTRDSCQLLSEYELGNAIYNFVEKGEKTSVQERVAVLLTKAQRHVWKAVCAARQAAADGAGGDGEAAAAAAAVIEPQAIVDLAFNHKKEVNKQFHDAQQQQTQRSGGRAGAGHDAVQDIIARAQQDDAPLAGATAGGGGLAASGRRVPTVVDDDGVPLPGGSSAPLPPAPVVGKKAAPKRSRAAAADGEPKAPATRGRKKEVAPPSQSNAPALSFGGGGGGGGAAGGGGANNDILAMWDR